MFCTYYKWVDHTIVVIISRNVYDIIKWKQSYLFFSFQMMINEKTKLKILLYKKFI